jgi:hypothetical protein
VLFRKSAHSLLVSYLVIMILYCLPVAVNYFAVQFYPESPLTADLRWLKVASPLATAFALPVAAEQAAEGATRGVAAAVKGDWSILQGYAAFTLILNGLLLALMMRLFQRRWRVVD